ncbi:hypothetical protein EJ110_NYTH56249 [Nymphaea thermarum]|nr:hypothetical protein EJ110_NYTH56249 [Nymphaea thermarum]
MASANVPVARRLLLLLLLAFVFVEIASATPPSSTRKRVRCRRHEPQFGKCYMVEQICPDACPTTCKMNCHTCTPVCRCDEPGAVCDDPRFIGGDGITFYFHGKKDKDFCLVSDTNVHINGHFIGKRGGGMNRDFTWVQSIGILFDNHRLFIGAKKVGEWDDAVDQLAIAFDGEPVFLPAAENAQWSSSAAASALTISRLDAPANEVVVEAPNKFRIMVKVVPIGKEESRVHGYGITDDDCFAHLDLGFRFYSLTGSVNGVLGQTYADNYKSRAKIGLKMPVLGGDREFLSSGLFATDCAAARFTGTASGRTVEGAVHPGEEDLVCKTGFNGRGMICKK